jgi:hypothetical protein
MGIDLLNLIFLTGTIPEELGDCISLGYLDISGGPNLVGTIPGSIFSLGDSLCVLSDYLLNCTLEFDCSDTLCGATVIVPARLPWTLDPAEVLF